MKLLSYVSFWAQKILQIDGGSAERKADVEEDALLQRGLSPLFAYKALASVMRPPPRLASAVIAAGGKEAPRLKHELGCGVTCGRPVASRASCHGIVLGLIRVAAPV